MEKKINKFIYWTPRILSILFILSLTMLSGDVFEENLGFWGTVLGLLVHNIPSFILSGILIISWKYEIVGGVAFILADIALFTKNIKNIVGLATSGFSPWNEALAMVLMISVPLIVGILFLIGWFKKRK